MGYDIAENKKDLHLLDNAEPNSVMDSGEYFMAETIAMADWSGNRCVDPEDYEIEVVELYQDNQFIRVSKQDIYALAKHFGITT